MFDSLLLWVVVETLMKLLGLKGMKLTQPFDDSLAIRLLLPTVDFCAVAGREYRCLINVTLCSEVLECRHQLFRAKHRLLPDCNRGSFMV
jgi:hypothetical protein